MLPVRQMVTTLKPMPATAIAAALLAFAAACSDAEEARTAGDTPTPAATETPAAETPQANSAPPRSGGGEGPDADRALEHARVLSVEIGPRVAGSAAEQAAASYIASEFESYGYDVELHEFEFEGNRYPPGELELGETTIEALSLLGSADGEATGRLVLAGSGAAQELDAVAVEGAIAVTERGDVTFQEMYENASERGAAGLVVVNNADGLLVGAQIGVPASIPVIGIAGSEQDAIAMAAEAGITATIRADGPVSSSVNVVARAPGTEQCLVLAGGHHDTVAASPGANDNASGVAHVLEVARLSANSDPPPGLCFATFGAEESGLHGSATLAAEMADAGALPTYMVNFDVTGLGAPVQAIGTEALIQRSIETGRELGISVARSILPPNLGSDHLSFERLGSEVLFLTTGMYDEYHSPEDTFDILEREPIDAVARAGHAIVMDLYHELADGE